jgi:hypothetical protein
MGPVAYPKEILAVTYHYNYAALQRFVDLRPEFRSGSVYLYDFLGEKCANLDERERTAHGHGAQRSEKPSQPFAGWNDLLICEVI